MKITEIREESVIVHQEKFAEGRKRGRPFGSKTDCSLDESQERPKRTYVLLLNKLERREVQN